MLVWLVYMGVIALTTGLGTQFRISRSAKVLGAQWQGLVHGSFTRLYASSSSDKKKIVFLGTPDFAANCLNTLINRSGANDVKSAYEIAAVVSQPPAPSGRSKKPVPSPVHIVAEANNITIFTPEKAKDEDFLMKLTALQPDLCITAAYGNFLPSKFLSIPKFGTLNIHPSLLPLYRGAAPVQRCLENGDDKTGVSIVFTVLKMDAGPLVKQIVKPLQGDEKAPEILTEMFAVGTNELIDVLPSVFDGTITISNAVAQDHARSTNATKLSVEEAKIDFATMNSKVIHNRLRGFAEWPGVWSTFRIGGSDEIQRIKLITTCVLDPNPAAAPATMQVSVIKSKKADILQIVCGDGSILGIKELQPVNKKVMDSKSFINGLRGNTDISWCSPPSE